MKPSPSSPRSSRPETDREESEKSKSQSQRSEPVAELDIGLIGCASLRRPLTRRGHSAATLQGRPGALSAALERRPAAIVLHADRLEDGDPVRWIRALRRGRPQPMTFLYVPAGDAALVRDALQAGFDDVLPVASASAAAERVASALAGSERFMTRRDQRRSSSRTRFHRLESRSREMWRLFRKVEQVAPTDGSVLLLGETGTGKELLARAIHKQSGREGRFVALNCGAVPESLIDDELFGHVRGSFTGATKDKRGLFRNADGGTLFLDEIGTIPMPAQQRLLRTLQEHAVRPVGGAEEIEVDVRIVAATNESLDDGIEEGRFREDLFFRLDVFRFEIPPLRERPEDIIHLFGVFLKRLRRRNPEADWTLTDDFFDALMKFDWPGNVRQLENVARRLILHQGETLNARHLHGLLRRGHETRSEATAESKLERLIEETVSPGRTLAEVVEPVIERLERAYLEAALAAHGGRIERSAEAAGISRRTLLRKLKEHDIDKKTFKKALKREVERD